MRGKQLREVVGEADQRPFKPHLSKAAQKELPDVARLNPSAVERNMIERRKTRFQAMLQNSVEQCQVVVVGKIIVDRRRQNMDLIDRLVAKSFERHSESSNKSSMRFLLTESKLCWFGL